MAETEKVGNGTGAADYGTTRREDEEDEVRPDDLSELLASGTKAVHDMAENNPFVKDFLKGRIRRELFKLGAVALYFTYRALEEELDRHGEHPQLAPIHFPSELARVPSLSSDLEYFYGPEWASLVSASPATCRYVRRLHEVGSSDPVLLAAHAYVRYMGDLSGGQVLGKVARRALRLPETGEGVAFYRFDGIDSARDFKRLYRARLNEIEMDGEMKKKVVEEAVRAFHFNIEVFEELEEIGKTLKDEVLDAGMPVHGALGGDVSKCPYHAAKMAASSSSVAVGRAALSLLRHPSAQVLLAAWVAALAGLAAWYLM